MVGIKIKNMKYLVFVFTILVLIISCGRNELKFQKHKSGLEYNIIEKINEDSLLKVGDLVSLHLSYETEDGKEIFNSKNSERKYLRTIAKPAHIGGSFEDGMLMLGAGDSAVFRVHAESFLRFSEMFANLPEGITYEDYLIVKVRVLEKITKEDYSKILAEKYHQSEEAEMRFLQKYLDNFNITEEPEESGLIYVERVKGKGKQAVEGSFITVHYSLMLIDGDLVETTLGREPFRFQLGNKNVIQGWEEGIAMMCEGGQATLIIPSKLAYGKEGKGNILPYTTLIFEVELLKVE